MKKIADFTVSRCDNKSQGNKCTTFLRKEAKSYFSVSKHSKRKK